MPDPLLTTAREATGESAPPRSSKIKSFAQSARGNVRSLDQNAEHISRRSRAFREGIGYNYRMKPIGEIIEQNITLNTLDPVAAGGFTQVPNFILRDPHLTIGAKLTYAMFLSYAWHNDRCFPGQERLAEEMGMSVASVSAFIAELAARGFVTIRRRGQGKTNLYTVHFQVTKDAVPLKRTVESSDFSRLKSRFQPADN